MKLSTVRTTRGPRLVMEASAGGVVDVTDAVGVAGVHDVGSLLAAGEHAMERLRELHAQDHHPAVPPEGLHFAPPVVNPSKIVCVGLNYRAHVEEAGKPMPESPMLFGKWPNALIGCGEPIVRRLTRELDYEAELAVVIGRTASWITEAEALDHIAGYTILNDVSARDLQRTDPGKQVMWSKSLDGFAPMGRWFVTRDEIPDWRAIEMRTTVNGELRQREHCADMIFGVEQLVAHVSRGVTLQPGDVIATGTPVGVGYGFDPPRYLEDGDVVEITMSGIGSLRTPVLPAPS
jgi:acylpyruvate hydrolase